MLLLKPAAWMNVSGRRLAALAERLGFGPADLILVHDDLDIPIGSVRVRTRSGDGGHRGVRSVLRAFRTDEIRRVRVGVGRPERGAAIEDFVATPFDAARLAAVHAACAEAADRALELLGRRERVRARPRARGLSRVRHLRRRLRRPRAARRSGLLQRHGGQPPPSRTRRRGLPPAPGVGLGFRRLSIIDLATGDQPISNEDGTVTVVGNGEVYNFRELREELAAGGHRFRSGSDIEVIVHLYEELGVDCVQRLRGMFGFALWDARRRRLHARARPLRHQAASLRRDHRGPVLRLRAEGNPDHGSR